ncbi:unnamed protein product [Closterium sp. NIES-65]|nr:unnamed protein product [Closterium sp. NIES-65]
MAEQQQLGPTQISVKDIPRLPVEQVRQIREQVEGEVKMLADSLASLRAALARIDASRAAVEAMAKQQEGASMLVPLTGSMYIAGTVAEPSHVLIDVGAGYYIEKSVEEAMGYCMRKAELLRANHDKFSEVARAKRQLLEEVTMVLQAKVRAAVQQQGGGAPGAAAAGAAQAGRIQAATS